MKSYFECQPIPLHLNYQMKGNAVTPFLCLNHLHFFDRESHGIIAQYMANLGAEVNHHKFHPQPNQFHPLHFFSSPDSGVIQENSTCSLYGINTVGIIRAPRGDGKEAIVLVTPYNAVKGGVRETLSLGIAYSVFSLLTRVTWLAKDIIWLVADSQYGEYAPVAAWLRDYHAPAFSNLDSLNTDTCHAGNNIFESKNANLETKIPFGIRRSGTMAAALVLEVAYRNENEDTLGIYAEASNGQMPNLDLINIVHYLAVHRQGLQVKVEKFRSLLNSKWLKSFGEVFESLGKLVKTLNPDWKFGISAADYVEGAATLASSLYYQVVFLLMVKLIILHLALYLSHTHTVSGEVGLCWQCISLFILVSNAVCIQTSSLSWDWSSCIPI